MNKTKKTELIELAKNLLSEHQMSILLNYKGLTAGDMNSLRIQLKDKEADLKIIKNNLVSKAIENTDYKFFDEYLVDQVAISYCNDPISLANIIINFAKSNENIKILAGSLDNKIVDFKTIESLSKLGSIKEVRAKFIGVLKAPGSQLVGVLDAFVKKEA